MSERGSSSKNTTPAPTWTPATGTLNKELKIPLPDVYYGDRSKFKQFMIQVELYIGFNAARFASDTEKVLWVCTLLRGSAANWIEGMLQEYLKKHRDGVVMNTMSKDTITVFQTFTGFKSRFEKMFGEIDEIKEAERVIQTLRQKGSAARYTAEFQQYSVKTKWDDNALKAQFYRGLKDSVKDELIKEETDTLAEMIKEAVIIDNRIHERFLEKKGHYSQHSYKARRDWPQPMELDATHRKELSTSEKRRYSQEKLCFNCGKPGHMARNCEKKKKFNKRNSGRKHQLNALSLELAPVEEDTSDASEWELLFACGSQVWILVEEIIRQYDYRHWNEMPEWTQTQIALRLIEQDDNLTILEISDLWEIARQQIISEKDESQDMPEQLNATSTRGTWDEIEQSIRKVEEGLQETSRTLQELVQEESPLDYALEKELLDVVFNGFNREWAELQEIDQEVVAKTIYIRRPSATTNEIATLWNIWKQRQEEEQCWKKLQVQTLLQGPLREGLQQMIEANERTFWYLLNTQEQMRVIAIVQEQNETYNLAQIELAWDTMIYQLPGPTFEESCSQDPDPWNQATDQINAMSYSDSQQNEQLDENLEKITQSQEAVNLVEDLENDNLDQERNELPKGKANNLWDRYAQLSPDEKLIVEVLAGLQSTESIHEEIKKTYWKNIESTQRGRSSGKRYRQEEKEHLKEYESQLSSLIWATNRQLAQLDEAKELGQARSQQSQDMIARNIEYLPQLQQALSELATELDKSKAKQQEYLATRDKSAITEKADETDSPTALIRTDHSLNRQVKDAHCRNGVNTSHKEEFGTGVKAGTSFSTQSTATIDNSGLEDQEATSETNDRRHAMSKN
jgi:Retrotransposon gag protein/Zinc knuckle